MLWPLRICIVALALNMPLRIPQEDHPLALSALRAAQTGVNKQSWPLETNGEKTKMTCDEIQGSAIVALENLGEGCW